jgi:hypothetical protein
MMTEWQWGGRRALWKYMEDENRQPVAETLIRPMTKYMHPHAGLDSRAPEFECPGDDGLEYWARVHAGDWDAQGLGRRPLHVLTGTSYYLTIWGGVGWDAKRTREVKQRPEQIVLVREAAMQYDTDYKSSAWSGIPPDGEPVRQRGWHGQSFTYTMLFLDAHAELKACSSSLSSGVNRGPDWRLMSYFYLMDYYR